MRFSELIVPYDSFKNVQKQNLTRYLKLAPQNTSECQMSAKSFKGFGSYEYKMKFLTTSLHLKVLDSARIKFIM